MGISRGLIFVCVVTAVGLDSVSALRVSPCPDLFQYSPGNQNGQWEGVLTLISEHDLHGVWARLIFDDKLTQLSVTDNFGEIVSSPGSNEYLLKNKDIVLKAQSPTFVKIKVQYEGDKAPNLIGFRLNAKIVCPEINVAADLFKGDIESKSFISNILVKPSANAGKPSFECGKVNPQANHYPWAASIYFKGSENEKYICEGTLISQTHVLTAAHCVTIQKTSEHIPPKTLKVYVGKRNLHEEPTKEAQYYNVRSIQVYPVYRPENLLNDLAIIELSNIVNINEYVTPICLAGDENKGGKEGVIVGYGLQKDKLENELAGAKVTELSSADCAKRNPEWVPLLQGGTKYCASYLSDKTECVGNSGSSLAAELPESNTWQLRGVVLYGVALQDKYVCDTKSSVLTADVSKYSTWIRTVIDF